ncbi:hypothetical protein HQ314_06310 [Rhodococcus sp. BP-332]|uniref:P-loop ATPase, Sll1717 family n=1 Tax=Rhodococcus sp. BP-332 TaxID=2739447 RepID=UPI001C9A2F65|nr:hypothetical protein [Rhodococcus sp. BP-332]MBY6676523.1 hypothetical protein [Rhodococcus sp. BP-332]
MAARQRQKKFNPVVFLRDDIYQDLQFEDKNKITENYSTNIRWDLDGAALSLRDLMEKRFSKTMNDGTVPVSWNSIFDESDDSRMPGRQTKYQHICDRTLLRPRDMIKFCNEILESHKAHESDDLLIANNAIHHARTRYSDYLLNEIDDEIAKHVPEYRSYLEIIKSVGSEKFELGDFENVSQTHSAPNETAPRDALGQLFEFSVVGYLRPGGRGGGSTYVWRYKDPRARFDPSASSFRVHPGFKEVLGLVR